MFLGTKNSEENSHGKNRNNRPISQRNTLLSDASSSKY